MATTKVKKEFAWDTEVTVKTIEVNEFEKRVISITTLNKKEFVVISTHKKVKGEWKPVKNATVPKEIWSDIADAVSDYDLKEAFGSPKADGSRTIQAPGKASKGKAAKKGAVINELLQGIKSSYEEKIARNENWAKLPAPKKKAAFSALQKEHEDIGMVTVGITGTNYMLISGKNQQQAEKEIKATPGFSRAKFTFFS